MGTGVVGTKSHPWMVCGVTWHVKRATDGVVHWRWGGGSFEGGAEMSWALKITHRWFAG